MPSSDPSARFRDIIDNIDAITSYVGDMGQEQFIADRLRYDATERCLSRISEAASKLGLLAEELAPKQPWNDIRGVGNWLRHDYPNVIRTVIWKTVSRDLKSLRRDYHGEFEVPDSFFEPLPECEIDAFEGRDLNPDDEL